MNRHVLTSLVVGLIISLSSCSKKEDPKPTYAINQTSVSINYDKEHQFTVKLGEKTADAAGFTWTSSDPSVGTISGTGLFKGKKIGSTTIKAEGNGTVLTAELTIKPYSTLFKEPIIEFGVSIATIKGKESRKLIEQASNGLLYEGENSKIKQIMYIFENSKLAGAAALFESTKPVVEEVVQFYSERYTYLGEDEDFFVFSDGKYLIGIGEDNTLGVHAIYLPVPATNTLKIGSLSSLFGQKLKEIELKSISK
ncbi:Ig-like domain-containing protein [Pedobacter gandavensis]|uniref:Ig-like domain-containing protein n=1 Tax=Pedobacter gandavensis TaxID=2679963 RepID=UPI00292DB2E1|nr:Ig-like domain-containing protein [Pedobacter gandavensis]